MATFETVGVLKLKHDTVQVSDKFAKREFVVSTDLSTQFPQHISFQLTQDKCAVLDGVNLGDEIKVSFNLRGNEYNNPTKGLQYFNTLQAWKVEVVSKAPQGYATSVDTMPSNTEPPF